MKRKADQLEEIQAMKEQIAREAANLDFEIANDLSPLTIIDEHGDVIDVPVNEKDIPHISRLRGSIAKLNNSKINLNRQKKIILMPEPVVTVVHAAPRTPGRRRGEGSRSSAKSGDSGDSDSDPDPERPLRTLQLLDASSLADLLCISKKTLQNRYSVTPHTLPAAISVPGARGPRWTVAAVQAWLESRPAHTSKPAPQADKKKVGRPRIALVGKGGAA